LAWIQLYWWKNYHFQQEQGQLPYDALNKLTVFFLSVCVCVEGVVVYFALTQYRSYANFPALLAWWTGGGRPMMYTALFQAQTGTLDIFLL
jgi:Ni,Fe-hydrogenase I cytochrome b subunit